jgi:hypothetical protein
MFVFSPLHYTSRRQGKRGRYSDWLRTGRPRDRSLSSSTDDSFLFSTSFRPTRGPNSFPLDRKLSGAQTASYPMGTGDYPVLMRPGREANHSTEINNTRNFSHSHTPSWRSAYSYKQRTNFSPRATYTDRATAACRRS